MPGMLVDIVLLLHAVAIQGAAEWVLAGGSVPWGQLCMSPKPAGENKAPTHTRCCSHALVVHCVVVCTGSRGVHSASHIAFAVRSATPHALCAYIPYTPCTLCVHPIGWEGQVSHTQQNWQVDSGCDRSWGQVCKDGSCLSVQQQYYLLLRQSTLPTACALASIKSLALLHSTLNSNAHHAALLLASRRMVTFAGDETASSCRHEACQLLVVSMRSSATCQPSLPVYLPSVLICLSSPFASDRQYCRTKLSVAEAYHIAS